MNHDTGVITTIAGIGIAGYGGDGGAATAAELNLPSGITVDSSGDVFIADDGNHRVREINHATGVITTVAGDGTGGYSGDGGPATAAKLDYPNDVAVDAARDLFIADRGNNRIREVNHATGVITTIAGDGTYGFAGDGGAATAAELAAPARIAVDAAGDVFIADTSNNRIREINHVTGIITTVAGDGAYGFSGDGALATSAELAGPVGIAVNADGDLFIGDNANQRVREVSFATGLITTLAGNGAASFAGDGGPAALSELNYPTGVTLDPAGNLLIADSNNDRIREITNGVTVTVAPAPLTITADAESKVYGAALPTLTASYSGFVNGDTAASLTTQPTPATTATASSPVSGSPYPITASGAADPNYTISYVPGALTVMPAPTSITLSASANSAVYGQAVNLTASVAASPSSPSEGSIAFYDNGTLLATEPVSSGAATLDNVDLPAGTDLMTASYSDASGNFASSSTVVGANSAITTVAGSGTEGYSGDGGPANAAELHYPYAVAVDASGDLFIADTFNNVVREVHHATGVITTVAGNGTAGYSGDGGQATAAELDEPKGVAVDSSGDLFITEGDVVREVNHATGIVNTVAGNGAGGFGGDGGPATAAELDNVTAVAVDSSGDLFIADFGNNRIREVDLAAG
ncbi:MAG: hypothetical protein B7Z74_02775, partial [Deltaproteobacteria bacterium 21-66-5]